MFLTILSTRRSQCPIPERASLESIMDNNWCITDDPNILVALLDIIDHGTDAALKFACQWFVEQLDPNNRVLVLVGGIFIGNELDDA